MVWFKHDTTALTDAKVKRLVIRHGAVGYAVYFHCLELIAGDLTANKITFELEHDAEIIADNLKIQGTGNEAGVDIVNKIMATIIELDLFQISGEKIVCLKLAKRLDSSMTSNKNMRAIIQGSHDGVMIESCKKREDKKRTEEKRIDIKTPKLTTRFKEPTILEVTGYCKERKNTIEPEKFIDYYISKGWLVGKTKMKDWKAAVRNWERSSFNTTQKIDQYNIGEHAF